MSWKQGDPERRSGYSNLEIHMAELARDISYIRERVDNFKESLNDHIQVDNGIHKKVERHSLLIGIIWAIFGLAALGTIAKGILDNAGITNAHGEEGNKGYVYKAEVPE